MRRETQNILLVLLGGALLKISFNGTYLRYVLPQHLPWLIATGVIMIGIAFVSIARDIMTTRVTAAEAGHDHEHRSHSTWLLLLPVFAVFLVAPPALGADSVMRDDRRTVPTQSESVMFPALPAGDVIPVQMKDFVTRATWDNAGSLNNRAVRLTGFVVQRDGSTYLARMVIGCCAADAYPVKIKLDGPGLGTVATNTWFEADVRLQPGTPTEQNQFTPTATVLGLKQIPEPDKPYEF